MSEAGADSTVYRTRDFYVYLFQRFVTTLASMVMSVAVAWQVYDIEHTALSLGLVGLCQFVPMFLLVLPAGELADRVNPRRILSAALLVNSLCVLLLLVATLSKPTSAFPFYLILILFGAARGFTQPVGSAMLPFLVPAEKLPRAIALSSSAFTTGVIVGPALGGFLYIFGPVATYSVCFAGFLYSALSAFTLGGRVRVHQPGDETRLERVLAGIRYVRSRPVIFGSISLDLFAVLLGGAVAMMPIYARDILHVGPEGLGLLRSAPAVGAALTALYLARYPVERHTGFLMFMSVAVFGIATIVFGISTYFWLSMVALFFVGASDMVSVYIRTSLVQLLTPDDMRGRVSSVNMLFIGASNELGEFESGVVAAWLGAVPAVIIGGLGTLAVVGLWMWGFPALRKIDRLEDASPS
jgi:MFS family permease